MMGNDADADDAAQDAVISIARGLTSFDGHSQFGTWAYRVTVNSCLDELRRRKRRPQPLEDAALERVQSPPATSDAKVDVDAALMRVPTEFRAAVVLRDLCGLDYAEIATVLQIPPGTVRSRIARGRAMVADLLGNPYAPSPRPMDQR